jgi:hypothetical protein
LNTDTEPRNEDEFFDIYSTASGFYTGTASCTSLLDDISWLAGGRCGERGWINDSSSQNSLRGHVPRPGRHKMEGVNLTKIYCKHFCKSHNVSQYIVV